MKVLLTGGSRGIGAATVRRLCEAGASVLFTYRHDEAAAARLAEANPGSAALFCDLANHDGLPAFVEAAEERLGGIDVLINNAAIFQENPFFANDFSSWRAGWERTFATNVFGTAHLTFLVLQRMRPRGEGRIVTIASRAAHRGELTFADYGASKAALVNLNKSIARACGPHGITAIAIAPGFVETEMASSEIQARGAEIRAEIPLGRIPGADDIARVVAFFASGGGDDANGATIDLNGGSYVR